MQLHPTYNHTQLKMSPEQGTASLCHRVKPGAALVEQNQVNEANGHRLAMFSKISTPGRTQQTHYSYHQRTACIQ